MSRSYKKFPGFSDGDGPKKWSKRQANKAVRNYKYFDEVDDGCWYKKLYERWNICDYNCRFYSDSSLLYEISTWESRDYFITGHKTITFGDHTFESATMGYTIKLRFETEKEIKKEFYRYKRK